MIDERNLLSEASLQAHVSRIQEWMRGATTDESWLLESISTVIHQMGQYRAAYEHYKNAEIAARRKLEEQMLGRVQEVGRLRDLAIHWTEKVTELAEAFQTALVERNKAVRERDEARAALVAHQPDPRKPT